MAVQNYFTQFLANRFGRAKWEKSIGRFIWLDQLVQLVARHIWAMPWETLFMLYANNKGTDPHSLISAYILYFLYQKFQTSS